QLPTFGGNASTPAPPPEVPVPGVLPVEGVAVMPSGENVYPPSNELTPSAAKPLGSTQFLGLLPGCPPLNACSALRACARLPLPDRRRRSARSAPAARGGDPLDRNARVECNALATGALALSRSSGLLAARRWAAFRIGCAGTR